MLKAYNIPRELFISFFLVVTTLVIFWQVKDHDFVYYDDHQYVTENPQVQAGLTAKSVIWAFTTSHVSNWHPLTWLSHMLDVEFFGLKPGGHHITNVILHIINTLLLFLVLYRMTKAVWQSAFVAAVFALHPLHVESVAWVAERKDVLSGFFWMLTMGAYVFYVERPGLPRYLFVVFFFALGLMSKPMLVTLPFVLLLLDYWPLHRIQRASKIDPDNKASTLSSRHSKRKKNKSQKSSSQGTSQNLPTYIAFQWSLIRPLILEKVPFFVLTAISIVVTIYNQEVGGALSSLQSLPLNVRLENALVSYVLYIGKMFWPMNLAVFYPHPGMLPIWQVIGAATLIAGVSLLVARAAIRFPYLPVGWLWYLGTLVPVIGIMQVGAQGMADRYTYVPLIGPVIMIAWGVPYIVRKWHYRNVVLGISAGLILAALSIGAWAQVRYWQNTITLFKHTLDVTSDNYIAHYMRGSHMYEQGKMDEAVSHYSEAIRINPDYAEAHYNMGLILASQGKLDGAVTHFLEAVRSKPNYEKAYNNLGNAFLYQGKMDKAMESFRKALEINPDYAAAHNNMGITLARMGKLHEAIPHFREAVWLRPDYKEAHYNLEAALAKYKSNDK